MSQTEQEIPFYFQPNTTWSHLKDQDQDQVKTHRAKLEHWLPLW